MPSASNPYQPPAEAQPVAAAGSPRLNWAGRLVLCLAFVAGVAIFAYCGLLLGSIVGLERGMPHITAPPTKGVGLAPDWSGLAHAAVEYVVAMILTLVASLIAGIVIAGVACGLLLAPILRRVRGLTICDRVS